MTGFAGLVHESWLPYLEPETATLSDLGVFLRTEIAAGHTYLPASANILRAFQTPFDSVRVLLMGQDPYPTSGHAVGLCFSVSTETRPLPKSLVNIFAELEADVGVQADSGDLTPWTGQGVMLLNRVLTVRAGEAGSHRGRGWERITEAAVRALGQRSEPLVAVLWGNDAQSVQPWLGQHPVVASVHPSPLSAHRGFFGSRPFSRVNELLAERGVAPIDWSL